MQLSPARKLMSGMTSPRVSKSQSTQHEHCSMFLDKKVSSHKFIHANRITWLPHLLTQFSFIVWIPAESQEGPCYTTSTFFVLRTLYSVTSCIINQTNMISCLPWFHWCHHHSLRGWCTELFSGHMVEKTTGWPATGKHVPCLPFI